jgi:hypothetical protein
MSTQTPTGQESAGTTDAPTTDPNPKAPVFGVDRRGQLHRYDTRADAVVVTDEVEITHVEHDVARSEVATWISYVGRERGWVDVWWDDDATDALGRLGAAKQAAAQLTVEADA